MSAAVTAVRASQGLLGVRRRDAATRLVRAASFACEGKAHNVTSEVRHMRNARLEAGRVQRMRHGRARSHVIP